MWVSILSPPEGRLQPSGRATRRSWPRFNPQPARGQAATVVCSSPSSSSPRFNPQPARGQAATGGSVVMPHFTISFNPQPARGQAATGQRRAHRRRAEVSILSPPEGRLQHQVADGEQGGRAVSILSPPEGRLQQGFTVQVLRVEGVSILSPPEGRLQPRTAVGLPPRSWFQSSARPRAGCNATCLAARTSPGSFNPQPARGQAATVVCLDSGLDASCPPDYANLEG